ncbi:hypothetical protein AQS8620_00182 [Aquimixticola soesokkakensis]|uniref:Uncharacterized protein n=2 Tax=Aquimixticola soesokkakensis TaxID=1519096 RepID=A0A1Y5RDD9_9RHOB|nr:hypothetical protein AQS8620_00182 [Aquimixticola soesokkakensis]
MIGTASLIVFALGATLPEPASSAQPRRLVVTRDFGGNLSHRVAEINALRASGSRVEIPRGHCMSACTMYLGLANTCVGRNAIFGFHGPSTEFHGVALPPREFEYWSTLMASYYPSQLRNWYMQKGRKIVVGHFEMRGADLIRMGVRECA